MHPNLSKLVCCWSGSIPAAPSCTLFSPSHTAESLVSLPSPSQSLLFPHSLLIFVGMKTHPLAFLRYLLTCLHVSFLLSPKIFENYNCGFFIFISLGFSITLINSRDFFGAYLLKTWEIILLSKNRCFIFSPNIWDRDLWWSILNF